MSTETVIFHQTVVEKAGMSDADHKYLDLLLQKGPMTAGRLAKLTGLTTGAITGIIDRLEQQGLVKRENDPNDRRKVLVVPQTEEVMKTLGPIFESLGEELIEVYDTFSEKELKTIRSFLLETVQFFQQKTRRLKKDK